MPIKPYHAGDRKTAIAKLKAIGAPAWLIKHADIPWPGHYVAMTDKGLIRLFIFLHTSRYAREGCRPEKRIKLNRLSGIRPVQPFADCRRQFWVFVLEPIRRGEVGTDGLRSDFPTRLRLGIAHPIRSHRTDSTVCRVRPMGHTV
jgi:hypothetical protein